MKEPRNFRATLVLELSFASTSGETRKGELCDYDHQDISDSRNLNIKPVPDYLERNQRGCGNLKEPSNFKIFQS